MSYASQHRSQWQMAGTVTVTVPSLGIKREIPAKETHIYLASIDLAKALLSETKRPSLSLRKYAESLGITVPFSLPNYPRWVREGVCVRGDNALLPLAITAGLPCSAI